jgi:ketosteroid isomerase-like protein
VKNAELARTYLDAVVARDYDKVESLLADDFRLRDLSPPGFTEVADVGAALSGLRELLDMFDSVRLVDSDAYEIGNVTYLRARVHFVHPEAGERMLEQHHLLTISDDQITAIDELCTGFFAP